MAEVSRLLRGGEMAYSVGEFMVWGADMVPVCELVLGWR